MGLLAQKGEIESNLLTTLTDKLKLKILGQYHIQPTSDSIWALK